MDIEIYDSISKISKSEYPIPGFVVVTFIFLISTGASIYTLLIYLGILILVFAIFIFANLIYEKNKPHLVEVGGEEQQVPVDPTLMRFLRVLEEKGIKILKEIEKAIKKLQKRAFFILESGESSPSVSVDKYIFCWSDVMDGKVSELKNFMKKKLGIKKFDFIEGGKDVDQELIILKRRSRTINLIRENRTILLEDRGKKEHNFVLKKVNGRENVYEKIGTRKAFFTQYINIKFPKENRYRFPLIGTSSFLVFAKDISDEKIIRDYRKFVDSMYSEIHKELGMGNNRYLFDWNISTSEDREKFMKFLRESHCIDWTYRARIIRSRNNKYITVAKGGNSIRFSRARNKVTMKISEDRSYEYILKLKNGEVKVYEDMKKTLESWYKNFQRSSSLVLVTRPYGFSIDYAITLFSDKMSKKDLDRLKAKMMDVVQQKIVIQNIRFSYLLEAVEYGAQIVQDFEVLEDRIVPELAEKLDAEVSEKDYFSKLITQDNFMNVLNKTIKKLKPDLFRRINRSENKFTKLTNLVGYINKHLEALV